MEDAATAKTQMTGKFHDGMIEGTWRGPTGETGWLTMRFAPDRESFNVEWGYHGRTPDGHFRWSIRSAAAYELDLR